MTLNYLANKNLLLLSTFICIFFVSCNLNSNSKSDKSEKAKHEEILKVDDEFRKAIVSNDVNKIKNYISDDWVVVDYQTGIIPQEELLKDISSGKLKHYKLKAEVLRVKLYDDIAIITEKGDNEAEYDGSPIIEKVFTTSVYKKENGKWRCLITHLAQNLQAKE